MIWYLFHLQTRIFLNGVFLRSLIFDADLLNSRFVVNRTRSGHDGGLQKEIDDQLKGSVFYWDIVHPDGMTGHKFMGEISAQVSRSKRRTIEGREGCSEKQGLLGEGLLFISRHGGSGHCPTP